MFPDNEWSPLNCFMRQGEDTGMHTHTQKLIVTHTYIKVVEHYEFRFIKLVA